MRNYTRNQKFSSIVFYYISKHEKLSPSAAKEKGSVGAISHRPTVSKICVIIETYKTLTLITVFALPERK